jgi:hypothetical protein
MKAEVPSAGRRVNEPESGVIMKKNYLHIFMIKRLFVCGCLSAICPAVVSAQQEKTATAPWNDSLFTVHGRLMFYNGSPSFRIWIIGTTHLLGIDEGGIEKPKMPDSLMNMINLAKPIYGDFTVRSLSKFREGEMQYVEIISFSNLVVREHK